MVALGVVSLFNDISSEMIYPLLPLFITSVLGAGASVLGAIEGVAEAFLSLTNLSSGYLSDKIEIKKPFILVGYLAANMARPLIGATSTWWQVLMLRSTDRVGKGIRTPSRDGLIALSVPLEARGAAFGFQRGMDNAGAFLGPLVAFVFLTHWQNLRSLFFMAALPGVIVVLVVLIWVREGVDPSDLPKGGPSLQSDGNASGVLNRDLLFYLSAISLFSLGNSSDAFLMLKANELGFSITIIPLLWMALHLSRALFSLPGGMIADRWGRRKALMAGWSLYGATYLGFALTYSCRAFSLLLIIYGLYFGLTEGAERALLSELIPSRAMGRGFGWFHGTRGFSLLSGNLLFGFIWQYWGAEVAFITGALFALLAIPFLLRVAIRRT